LLSPPPTPVRLADRLSMCECDEPRKKEPRLGHKMHARALSLAS
jgi:hypothetical protein